jgi:hypothetical protein
MSNPKTIRPSPKVLGTRARVIGIDAASPPPQPVVGENQQSQHHAHYVDWNVFRQAQQHIERRLAHHGGVHGADKVSIGWIWEHSTHHKAGRLPSGAPYS